MLDVDRDVLRNHLVGGLQGAGDESVGRPIVGRLRQQLAGDGEVVVSLDHLLLAALGVGLRLEHGDGRKQPHPHPRLVLVNGAVGERLGLALHLEVLARPDDVPVRLDHLLDEVGHLCLVLVDRGIRHLLCDAYDEVGEVPAEVPEERLDEREVERRLVLRAELLEAGIGVQPVVQEVDGRGGAGPEGLQEVQVGAPVVRDEGTGAGQRARVGGDAAPVRELARQCRVEGGVGLQDARALSRRLEPLGGDAGVVLERDADRLLERHALHLLVARDRRRNAERVALRQAPPPRRDEPRPAPRRAAGVGGPRARTRQRREQRRHGEAGERDAARHCECR